MYFGRIQFKYSKKVNKHKKHYRIQFDTCTFNRYVHTSIYSCFHCFCRRFVNSANGLDLFLWCNVPRFAWKNIFTTHVRTGWCLVVARWIDAWHLFVKFEATILKVVKCKSVSTLLFYWLFFFIKFAPHSRRPLPPHIDACDTYMCTNLNVAWYERTFHEGCCYMLRHQVNFTYCQRIIVDGCTMHHHSPHMNQLASNLWRLNKMHFNK